MTLMTLNNMRRVFFFIAVVAMMATSAFAQQPTATTERGKLAPTPPMGWMTWNMFKGDISEQLIKEIADAMVESGLRDAGYKYVFIDDLWQGGRDNRNNIIPDPKKFPNGIKALADYVHSKGLKLGIYSDAAQLTCGGCTASYGFEEQDARTFASWGVDYLKYDYCNAPEDSATARLRYKTMADALSKSGRDIVLGICEWGQRNGEEWCEHVGGQLWRTSSDVRDMWKDIVNQGGVGISTSSTSPRHCRNKCATASGPTWTCWWWDSTAREDHRATSAAWAAPTPNTRPR